MIFFLGVHRPNWLRLTEVPLFVSRRTLGPRRELPRARAAWALDSGGFTEISLHGEWTVSPKDYVTEVRRFARDVGSLAWAAPQDWMCEPTMLRRTGLSVADHQARTVANYLELRSLAPDLPWIPVLQGWAIADYWRHVDAYADANVDLTTLPLVGVGTVCRRQHTRIAGAIFSTLAASGLRLHGFGVKVTGLRAFAGSLVSADSMAWSFRARRSPPLYGHQHMNCANCLPYALQWRRDLLESMQ